MKTRTGLRITSCAAALAAVFSVSLASAGQYDEPVTLPREVVTAAAAFQSYMERAASISSGFRSPDSVYEGLKTGVGYEQAQFQTGMIGYGAIVALQDDRFTDTLDRISHRPDERDALVQRLLADPNQVMALDGAQGAARRVRLAFQRRADAVQSTGRAVKQSAYDVQHQAWSKARVANPQKRLAEVKAISATRQAFTDGEEGRLVRSLIDQNRMSDSAEAPTPVMVRSLALAAMAELGQARSRDMPRLQVLLTERSSADCLRWSKLNLYQCMAVAGPHYEDIFCLGQHALIDTGQCVAKAASFTPAQPALGASRVAESRPASMSMASASPATLPRAFRGD